MKKRHPHKRAIPAEVRAWLRGHGGAWWLTSERRQKRFEAMKQRWQNWRLVKAVRVQTRAKRKVEHEPQDARLQFRPSTFATIPWWRRLWAWLRGFFV